MARLALKVKATKNKNIKRDNIIVVLYAEDRELI